MQREMVKPLRISEGVKVTSVKYFMYYRPFLAMVLKIYIFSCRAMHHPMLHKTPVAMGIKTENKGLVTTTPNPLSN